MKAKHLYCAFLSIALFTQPLVAGPPDISSSHMHMNAAPTTYESRRLLRPFPLPELVAGRGAHFLDPMLANDLKQDLQSIQPYVAEEPRENAAWSAQTHVGDEAQDFIGADRVAQIDSLIARHRIGHGLEDLRLRYWIERFVFYSLAAVEAKESTYERRLSYLQKLAAASVIWKVVHRDWPDEQKQNFVNELIAIPAHDLHDNLKADYRTLLLEGAQQLNKFYFLEHNRWLLANCPLGQIGSAIATGGVVLIVGGFAAMGVAMCMQEPKTVGTLGTNILMAGFAATFGGLIVSRIEDMGPLKDRARLSSEQLEQAQLSRQWIEDACSSPNLFLE